MLGRLGRHVEHDPRSKAFSLTHPPIIQPATWTRFGDIFNQGNIGSCTGNAMAGCLNTSPFFKLGGARILLQEREAVALYSIATQLDQIRGHYPPDDTGSSGLAVAKAAMKLGYIKAYHHAFGLQAVLAALGHGPGILGIPWYEGFDNPIGPHGELRISGAVRGGHEVQLSEINVSKRMVRGPNSWGNTWADKGYFTMSFDTLGALLSQDGDFVVPVPA